MSRTTRKHPRAGRIRVTDRDYAVLDAVGVHRYMRADHFHALLSRSSGIRVVQWRLRRLWRGGYLDRRYLPYVARGNTPLPRRATRPIYALTTRAAELLRRRQGALDVIPHGFKSKSGALPALEHHLVVTDFMIALRIASEHESDFHLLTIEHEHVLWPRLAKLGSDARHGGLVVPDGAFTVLTAGGKQLTFYLEVVRAGVKGGNRRGLRGKLAQYSKLNHRKFFDYAYGHKNLRAVLFTTTSETRAAGFRAHAELVRHGQKLFWFGSYRSKTLADDETVFSPATILTSPWSGVGDASLTLADAVNPKPV